MTKTNEKHSIQQDVSTKEQEPFTELGSMSSDLLCKIDMLIGESYDLEKKIASHLLKSELKPVPGEPFLYAVAGYDDFHSGGTYRLLKSLLKNKKL